MTPRGTSAITPMAMPAFAPSDRPLLDAWLLVETAAAAVPVAVEPVPVATEPGPDDFGEPAEARPGVEEAWDAEAEAAEVEAAEAAEAEDAAAAAASERDSAAACDTEAATAADEDAAAAATSDAFLIMKPREGHSSSVVE